MYDLNGRIGFWNYQHRRSTPLFVKSQNPNPGQREDRISIAPIGATKVVVIPPQQVMKDYARAVLNGNQAVFENAPKIPPKVLNIICEYILLEIVVNKIEMTPKRVFNYKTFMSAECLPWHTLDSVSRRICKAFKGNCKWLISGNDISLFRSRILAEIINHSPEKWWGKTRAPKRLPS